MAMLGDVTSFLPLLLMRLVMASPAKVTAARADVNCYAAEPDPVSPGRRQPKEDERNNLHLIRPTVFHRVIVRGRLDMLEELVLSVLNNTSGKQTILWQPDPEGRP